MRCVCDAVNVTACAGKAPVFNASVLLRASSAAAFFCSECVLRARLCACVLICAQGASRGAVVCVSHLMQVCVRASSLAARSKFSRCDSYV